MRFLKKIAGILGFSKEESQQHEAKDEEASDVNRELVEEEQTQIPPYHHLPRKGFSVPVQVAVERPQVGPVLLPTNAGDGGVQGFRWYARRLRIDEEGDVADEFLDEVLLETKTLSISEDKPRSLPRFEVKYSTLPAKVRNQVLTREGKIRQSVEHQGRLMWI